MKENFFYISIDPYQNRAYAYDQGVLKNTSLKRAKKHYYISFLRSQDFITTQLKLSKKIEETDLPEAIAIQTYEELDLDHTLEYRIDYEELFTSPNEKDRIFNVFVTEKKIIESIFNDIVATTGYIDLIVPVPLYFKTLYTNNILPTSSTDLFLYFQQDDAFLVIYKNGQFLYTKSLKYSFSYIAERLSEMKQAEVSVEEVMQDLSEEGLRISDLNKLQYYMQIFSELFLHINDVLIYAKRANNLESIDNIFIGSSIGSIQGIEEYCQTYLAQSAFELSFDYKIESKEPFIEDLHFLAILVAKDYVQKGEHYPNLTIYPRPLPFFKRPVGELTLVVAASVIFGFTYPLYNYALGLKYQYEVNRLQKEYPAIHAQKVALESRINELKKRIQELKTKKTAVEKNIETAKRVLEAIYTKKVDYKMKSKILADLTQEMVRHKLLITSIDNNRTLYNFKITSSDDKAITQFIQHIAEKKANTYDITTKDINKTDNVYTSKLEVKVK